MASLRQYAEDNSIDIEDIEALFYNHFPYRVTTEYANYRSTQKLSENLVGYSKSKSLRSYPHGYLAAFFFKTEADALTFLKEVKLKPIKIALPVNDDALSLHFAKENVVIRDKLYWNKYRYRIECRRNASDDSLEQIIAYTKDDDEGRFTMSSWSPLRIYCVDEMSALQLNLMFAQYFERTIRVVLKDEIGAELQAG